MNTNFEIANGSKQLDGKVSGKNFEKIDLGAFDKVGEYIMENKDLKLENKGKIFIHNIMHLTGSEISINSVQAHTTAPFKHKHKENEEVYIILEGNGVMEIDGQQIDVKEGSVVKVNPAGIRSIDNNSDKELIFLVMQTKANSLNGYTLTDAEIV